MKKKWWLLLTALLLLGSILSWTAFQRAHTFTLSGSEEKKNEQIQPLFQTVKVSGDCDTDVVFTDTETGEEYLIRIYHPWGIPNHPITSRQMVHGGGCRKLARGSCEGQNRIRREFSNIE